MNSLRAFILAVGFIFPLLTSVYSVAQATPAPAPVSISLGTVKSIAGNSITLTTDAGTELNVTVAADARLLRTAPGRKDLQGATPVQLSDVQADDRILARGKLAEDGKTVMANSVIVMKREDIAQKQQQEQEDWRRRGVSGVVKSLDPSTQTVTISTGSPAAKNIAVHVSNTTVLRRYSSDSVKFDDAKSGTFSQIKAGDQLRARGDRNPDGSELTAEEIVSGTFRNIAGTVISTDAVAKTLTVSDLLSKKPVTVKINADSEMHKLPQMMAVGIAARLKGGAAATGSSANSATPHPQEGVPSRGEHQGEWQRPEQGGNAASNHPPGGRDIQHLLTLIPPVALSDLQKGDAVILVATEGSETSQPTAITLLTGVEPILTAAPDQAAMSLSPWSLGAPTADAGP